MIFIRHPIIRCALLVLALLAIAGLCTQSLAIKSYPPVGKVRFWGKGGRSHYLEDPVEVMYKNRTVCVLGAGKSKDVKFDDNTIVTYKTMVRGISGGFCYNAPSCPEDYKKIGPGQTVTFSGGAIWPFKNHVTG